jgi:hypothetical protein
MTRAALLVLLSALAGQAFLKLAERSADTL